jgi:hypothetical protein
MMALRYETFIKDAFGYASGGKIVERWGDPAGIANTDNFDDMYINSVKAGVSYSVEIFSNAVINKGTLSDSEVARLENFTKQVIDATNVIDINSIIKDFDNTVIKKYFNISNGKVTLL